ncbi:hypothetical protein MTO96_045941, partial [Rhipicephalus appendiculatus]
MTPPRRVSNRSVSSCLAEIAGGTGVTVHVLLRDYGCAKKARTFCRLEAVQRLYASPQFNSFAIPNSTFASSLCSRYSIRLSDCRMSEWGPWSECDADCGPGGMGRERTILEQPRNGGLSCGELRQRRGCYGHRCNSKPQDKIHR